MALGIVCFFAGIMMWTFAEYFLHRFLGHEFKGKNFFKKEHSAHHSIANYFAPAGKKIIVAFIIAVLMVISLHIFLPTLHALLFVIGFIGMYGLYEITHYRYHAKEPLIPPFIILRKHHFYHHFHNPMMNHGVTTRFWDRVFNTFREVDTVKVPKQMSMKWLENNGEIKPFYAKHFRLNTR